LVTAIRAHGHRDVTHVPKQGDLAATLLKRTRPGDIVITLGAGSITRVGPELLAALK
jgi:UDP-N-acetylmuramate--alanine ligase